MIKSFAHKGLKELYIDGRSRRIPPGFITRCGLLLKALDAAKTPEEMNVAGYRFHGLHGQPKRWSVRVNKNWRMTFVWDDGAAEIDLEDYH
jgi:proteic killer suppression protein